MRCAERRGRSHKLAIKFISLHQNNERMKYLFYIFISLTLFACENKQTAAKLQLADSLMASRPDSALAVLRAIKPADISTDKQRAHYAILRTKAQYKNYIPFTSDSLINIAVDYYSSSADKNQYAQAILYKGSVLQDMKMQRLALDWLKQAETLIDSTDYLTLGLINTRIGEIYKNVFDPGSEDILRYKNALKYYKLAGHKEFESSSLSSIGQLYILENYDSSHYYINQAIDINRAQKKHQSTLYNLSLLSLLYNEQGKYNDAKQTALFIINNKTERDNTRTAYAELIKAYTKLGMVDSAKYFLKQYPNPITDADNVCYYLTLEYIAIAQNDYKSAYQYSTIATAMADSIIRLGREQDIYSIETQFEIRAANQKATELKSHITVQNYIITISFLVVIILVMALVFLRKRKKLINEQQMRFTEQLQADFKLQQANAQSVLDSNMDVIASLNKTIEERAELENSLRSMVEDRVTMVRKLITLRCENNDAPEKFIQKFTKTISVGKKSKADQDKIVDIANKLNNGIIDYLAHRYPRLNERDKLLLSLICLQFTPAETYIFLNTATPNAVYVLRSRLCIKLDTKSLENFVKETLTVLKNK